MNQSRRPTRDPYCSQGIVRRMVNLPKSIAEGFSRVMSRLGSVKKDQNLQFQPPLTAEEELAFLSCFEQQYGSKHPRFYACHFVEALKIAEDEHKFVFMYLHSPLHPFTPSFCSQTLCSELVVQFLDSNFVCWGALSDRGEGLQMASTLQPATFPCCAVVAPAASSSVHVLQQMEGPVSPGELVEILQRTVEEQGSAFGNNSSAKQEMKRKARAKEEEKIRTDRLLRGEQDAAYLAALKTDKEKEKNRQPQQTQKQSRTLSTRQNSAQKQSGIETRNKDPQATMILIRFPNGERKEQSFSSSEKVQSVYKYIDSLGLPGIVNYRLVSNFPRRVFGVDQMGMSLRDAGFHPKATLFLELLSSN